MKRQNRISSQQKDMIRELERSIWIKFRPKSRRTQMKNHYRMNFKAKVKSATQKDLNHRKIRRQADIKLMIQVNQPRNARLRNPKSGTTRVSS